MGQVDSEDDTMWRWVIHHYRFDPERGERRNVVVAAYDNQREFEAELARYGQRIRTEIEAGTRSGEHVGGQAHHPGYRAEQARAHLVRRAIAHGVDPRPLLQDGKLPSNMAVYGVDESGKGFSYGGGQPPEPPRRAPR